MFMEKNIQKVEETLYEQYRKELISKIEKLQRNKEVIFTPEGDIISKYKVAYGNLKKEITDTLLKYCVEALFSFYCIPNTQSGLELAAKMKALFMADYGTIKDVTITSCDIERIDEQLSIVHSKIVDAWWIHSHPATMNSIAS